MAPTPNIAPITRSVGVVWTERAGQSDQGEDRIR